MLLGEWSIVAIWDWVSKNKEWLFSGVGVVVLLGILAFFKNRIFGKRIEPISLGVSGPSAISRAETRILFIDDDTSFKVVDILKASGWTNTRIKEDITTLHDQDLLDADIVFVDIQGVGKSLGFKDDGLGLTKAIKETYPRKHVVVYSAENRGNRFHEGLKAADDFLSKTAQPYEFQKIVEDFAQSQSK